MVAAGVPPAAGQLAARDHLAEAPQVDAAVLMRPARDLGVPQRRAAVLVDVAARWLRRRISANLTWLAAAISECLG